MRRVIIVAYFFPPLGGAGVQRSLKFVKYLPSLGWLPEVVTVLESDYPRKDPSLLAEVPAEATIHRTDFRSVWKPWSWLPRSPLLWRLGPFVKSHACFPDEYAGWIPHAVQKCLELIETTRPAVLYTTSAPYSAHLVGLAVKKATGIPWVADLRDEWTRNPYLDFPGLARVRHRSAERAVLRSADAVISVTEGITAQFAELAGMTSASFHTIPNGYDEADFFGPPPAMDTDTFNIVYSGMFYGGIQPTTFLAGLELALGRDPGLRRVVRFVVAGDNLGNPHINGFRYPELIERLGYVDHARAVRTIRAASLLLVVVPRDRGADCLTGKLLEYLATDRPILALAPTEGIAARVIRRANAGTVVEFDSVPDIANAIASEFRRWRDGIPPPARDREYVESYTRRRTARQLAGVLAAASSGRTTAPGASAAP